ncbi:MAG TPA: hypothetical protein VGR89_03185 [Puia sp.]|nr:hypothetical protein [Puia sp.]
MDLTALPAPPVVVDYSTRIPADGWGMCMNGPDPANPPQIPDGIGDCTFAEATHDTLAQSIYAGDVPVTIPNSSLLTGYHAVGGYVLGEPSTDNGCVIQQVLSYRRKTGLLDSNGNLHKILAFGQLKNLDNFAMVKTALYIFGSIDIGVNFPSAAMTQFDEGLPWAPVRGDSIEGGHCVCVQRFDPTVSDGYIKVVTWGQEQAVRLSWWDAYVEEAWCIITQDWLSTVSDETLNGLDLAQLNTDLGQMTNLGNPLGLSY